LTEGEKFLRALDFRGELVDVHFATLDFCDDLFYFSDGFFVRGFSAAGHIGGIYGAG
jgi:hypothetical protein